MAVETKDSYIRGVDTVSVSFRSANPRNDQKIEGTFLTVDHLLNDGSWETRYTDGDWSTTFFWESGIDSFGVSFARIDWEIPNGVTQGIYRICHFGTRKTWVAGVEWLVLRSTDWWARLDTFGSTAIGVLIQTIKVLGAFSQTVHWLLGALDSYKTKDFSGCSRSFLVRSSVD